MFKNKITSSKNPDSKQSALSGLRQGYRLENKSKPDQLINSSQLDLPFNNNRLSKSTQYRPQLRPVNQLPLSLRISLERMSGVNLSEVRVHYNSSKPSHLNSLAYAQGHQIYLGPGQEKLLPHEAWHVVQQSQGKVRPTMEENGVKINDEKKLEDEADQMGGKAILAQENNCTDFDAILSSGPMIHASAGQPIQRAMKFEYQIKKNRLLKDDGEKVRPLPRKYGPEDYIVQGRSGVRFESETDGQPEFETGWSRNWAHLSAQIDEAHQMTKAMTKMSFPSNKIEGSDGKMYGQFPFSKQINHLGPKQGFRTSGKERVRWTRSQKTKKFRVTAAALTVFSYGSRSLMAPIHQLKRDDLVEVVEKKGKWTVVKFKVEGRKIRGAVKNTSLKQVMGWYESNSSRDSILQIDEKLLVEVNDPSWKAYIQPSESFELEQFDSYHSQYRDFSGGGRGTFKREDTYDDVVSYVNQLMKGLSPRYSGLRNFLQMVVYYISVGGDPRNSVRGTSAKHAFPLMNRTNFGSIFESMSEDEQAIFKRIVKDKKGGILPVMGVDPKRRLLIEGHNKRTGPSVGWWLAGITKGEDRMSGAGYPGAMGKFRIEDEVERQKELVRFEARESGGNSQTANKWKSHAWKHFKKAMVDRKRDSGRGKTGLKTGNPQKSKSLN